MDCSRVGSGAESLSATIAEPEETAKAPEEREKKLDASLAMVEERQQAKTGRSVTGIKWALIVVAILSTNFLFALDNTIVANIQPAIVADLGEIDKLPWISAGFPLGATATNFLWGRLYSHLSVKWLYISSIVLFEVGSVFCGAAPSMNLLIGGRVLGGLGCQGMYIGVMTFIGSLTTVQERPVYVSLGGLVWGVGTVLGPVIGAAFTQSAATWRWSFYINLCVGALFAPVYLWLLPSFRIIKDEPVAQQLRQLDFLGAFLLAAATPLLVLAISLGGTVYAWDSAAIIVFFTVSGGLFIALGIQQQRCILTTESQRILPVQLLRAPELGVLCVQTAGATTTGLIAIYFLPLYFQFLRGTPPLQSAVHLLPLIILLVFSCFLSGGFVAKNGRYMPWFLLAAACSVAGSALMYTVGVETPPRDVYGYSVLIGIGAGLAMQLPFSVAQVKVAAQDLALANGLISQAQVGGLVLALAIAQSIFLNQASQAVAAVLPNASLSQVQALISGVAGDALMSLPQAQQSLVLVAVVDSLRKVYLVVVATSCITLITSLFLKRGKLF